MKHPKIIEIFNHFEDDDYLYILMEFIDGCIYFIKVNYIKS